MPDAKTDFSVFSHPRILFDQIQVAAGATQWLAQNRLKTSRDMLVDWIAISEETFSLGVGAASNNFLRWLQVNWNVNDRAMWFAQGTGAAAGLANFYEADRTSNPVGAVNTVTAPFLWRHPIRWVYNPNQNVAYEWLIPGMAAGNIAVVLNQVMGLHGVGMRTGHRRGFVVPITPLVGAVAPVSDTASVPATGGNLGDEPYLIESTIWVPDQVNWDGGDSRWLNHFRVKVKPTQGDAWSEIPVPLVFYGVHQGIANRAMWYKPPGGPILLKAGQSMIFQLLNGSNVGGGPNVAMNVQVALIGRVAPGIGSLT